ncbi:MAG: hypothetical protein C5B50_01960 [Verrucomicrobia bacterium]|nr:MAG: hypothetical protein C5B50_01960 [Verrucomicrobiota bacterium]
MPRRSVAEEDRHLVVTLLILTFLLILISSPHFPGASQWLAKNQSSCSATFFEILIMAYTHTLSSSFANPLGGRSAWTGSSGGFITQLLAK